MKELSPPADIVLYNARAITLEPVQPSAELIAIKGNKVLCIGRNDDLGSFKGTKTEIIDCHGRTIVPGFNDAHCHPPGFATHMLSVECRPPVVRSIADIQDRLSERAAQTPRGKWIKAIGYNEFYLAEKRHPNRWDLDKAVPCHPVKLSHRSGHACVLNSLALQLVGISIETPEPPGVIIERDLETGEPNGLLYGLNPFVEKVIPPLSDEELGRAFGLADQEYLSRGITSLQDASWTDGLKRWQRFHRLKERGELTPRLSMMIGAEDIDEFQGIGLSMGSGDSQLRLGGVKIVLQMTTGSQTPPQEELNRLAYKAHEAGFQLAFHVVEESTLEAALTALEHLLRQIPKSDHRHRIEHCSVCPPHMVRRLKRMGAMVVTQPLFIYYNGERYLATVSQDEMKWFYPIGSLLSSGIEVAASSDSPIVPFDPLIGMYAAVTRKAETGQSVLPQEGISSLEALKIYTLGAAYASFEEKLKGSIATGKLADLVVLSDDPTRVPPEEIKEIQVLMTIVDGKVVWERK